MMTRKYRQPTSKRPGYVPVARVGKSYQIGEPQPTEAGSNQFVVRCATCGTASMHPIKLWSVRTSRLRACPTCGQPFLYVKSPWRALPWTDPATFRLEDYQELPDLPADEPAAAEPSLLLTLRDAAERRLATQDSTIEALAELARGLEQRVAALEQYIQAEHELTRYLIQRSLTTYTRAAQRLNGTAPDRAVQEAPDDNHHTR